MPRLYARNYRQACNRVRHAQRWRNRKVICSLITHSAKNVVRFTNLRMNKGKVSFHGAKLLKVSDILKRYNTDY